MCITLHLLTLKFICHFITQSLSFLSSFFKPSQTVLSLTAVNNVISAAGYANGYSPLFQGEYLEARCAYGATPTNLPLLWSSPYLLMSTDCLQIAQYLKEYLGHVFPLLLCRDPCPPIISLCIRTPFPTSRPPSPSPSRAGDAQSYIFLPTMSQQRSASRRPAGSDLGSRRSPGAFARRGRRAPAPHGTSGPAVPTAPSAGERPARPQIPAGTITHSLMYSLPWSFPSHGAVTALQKLCEPQQQWEMSAF